MDITSSDRILQHASLNFDASVLEIFVALTTGATLILSDQSRSFSADRIAYKLISERITFIAITPSLLSVLPLKEYPHLRQIVLGGEAASQQLVEKWRRGRSIYNAYAPTEATVFCTLYKFHAKDEITSIPLGRPIRNTQVFLLDQYTNLLPVGVKGEICISGIGLSKGYIGNEDENRKRFGFIELGGKRIRYYRSGDFGRYTSEGHIEFLGRQDDQVKIRGMRIELGEIKNVLNTNPDISGYYLTVIEQNEFIKSLALYVIASDQLQETANKIRSFLKERLPYFMVPDYIVEVPEIPLNDNGKVDLNKLKSFDLTDDARVSEPRNEVEAAIHGLLCETLVTDHISIDENFFHRGMHSLLASQFQIKLNSMYSINLLISDIFEFPTVASLAEKIMEKQIEEADRDELEKMLEEVERM